MITIDDVTYEAKYGNSFDDLFPYWPDFCCPLTLTRMKTINILPEKYIKAGTVDGLDYAYVLVLVPVKDNSGKDEIEYNMGFKSANFDSLTLTSYWTYCVPKELPSDIIYVLTNGNNCSFGWQATQFAHQKFPHVKSALLNNSGFLANNRFFPELWSELFA